jgi:polar amino acid transport system substrate-binding protein
MTLVPASKNLKQYRFSDPFFAFGPVIVLRIDQPYKNLGDLKDKMVGFDRSYGSALEGRSDIQFFMQPYDQMSMAMEDLLNQKLDAVVLDSILAYQYAKSFYQGRIKVVMPPLKETDLRLVTKIGKNDRLIKLFNDGLKEIKEQGLYDKMLEYWSLINA